MNKILILIFMACLSITAYGQGEAGMPDVADSVVGEGLIGRDSLPENPSVATRHLPLAGEEFPSLEAGEALTSTCVACHGEQGNSPVPEFPNIAGQTRQYLLKQLLEIQSGERPMPVMDGMLDGLSETDLNNISAYYASQESALGAADAALVKLGEAIYRFGISRKSIAACTACHSPTGSGNGPAGFPALAGQWPAYTIAQLKAFRAGERHNDGEEKMMQTTTEDMNDKEIEAVASYLYGLRGL